MLILLPPSETKRDGGSGKPVNLAALAWPEQTDARRAVMTALVALASDEAECARVLKLSPKQLDEVGRNRELASVPTMPAIDRFTGTLYDALDAASLPATARKFASKHVAIGSACFGLVRALDCIPAYRLSFDSKLPGLGATLKKHWSEVGAAALAGEKRFVLDARSEGYAALAPLSQVANWIYLRVVTRGEGGVLRALNHFNKKGKGEFVRALCLDSPQASRIRSVADLLSWASENGWEMELGAPGEVNLVVSGVL